MRSNSKWVILGKVECSWCDKAKALFNKYDIEFQEFELNMHPDLRNFLIACGITTVPQVYLNGQRLGGYEELKQWIDLMYPASSLALTTKDKDQLDLPL